MLNASGLWWITTRVTACGAHEHDNNAYEYFLPVRRALSLWCLSSSHYCFQVGSVQQAPLPQGSLAALSTTPHDYHGLGVLGHQEFMSISELVVLLKGHRVAV